MRTGVIAKKVGMTRLFQEDGRHVPVTVLALEELPGRLRAATTDRDGYVARPARRGRGQGEERRQAAARRISARPKSSPRRRSPNSASPTTRCSTSAPTITADHFVAGQLVDIAGHTQGKGFAGAHEALGLRRYARHPRRLGLAPFARFDRPAPGSGQVFKNKKMAGHMGDRKRTQQNLEVVRTDAERGLIFVKGSVPGARAAGCSSRTRSRCRVTRTRRIPAGSRQEGEDRARGSAGRHGREPPPSHGAPTRGRDRASRKLALPPSSSRALPRRAADARPKTTHAEDGKPPPTPTKARRAER